jgi:hypothetical protein
MHPYNLGLFKVSAIKLAFEADSQVINIETAMAASSL